MLEEEKQAAADEARAADGERSHLRAQVAELQQSADEFAAAKSRLASELSEAKAAAAEAEDATRRAQVSPAPIVVRSGSSG